ncbi:HIT family protein [Candidatus Parcubacteria bacterium]|nr:MAG: HIT family protein [Candidatus Parcubacteria bacterium]
MTSQKDCLFCRIRDKELTAKIVYEDDHALGILDIQPRAPGHTMVIPKYHSATLVDLPDSEIQPLFSAVKKIAERLKNELKADGLTIGINHGKVSGQMVDHLHIHVFPRFQGDQGGAVQGVVNNPPKEPVDSILKKIAF